MNLAGQALRFHTPDFVRRRALRELFQSTAAAFDLPAPALNGASADELLDRYAAFTAEHGNALLGAGERLAATRRSLYLSAYSIGTRLRRELGIESTDDAMAAARSVYRMLRIDFMPVAADEAQVSTCYFSRYYSAPVCRLMSALDQGLWAGLSGGGRLEFRQRITEGAPCCLAAVTSP
jgi:hypothetical protein